VPSRARNRGLAPIALFAIGCLYPVSPAAAQAFAAPLNFRVLGNDPLPWPRILSSVGFQPEAGGSAEITVIREGAAGAGTSWLARVEEGAFVILEGRSQIADWFGFRPGDQRVRVQNLEDLRRPQLPIIWEQALELPRFNLPASARVFARDRWSGAPLMAGFRQGAGAVLWVAAPPGGNGYERFPYLLHALADLGLEAPFRSRRLWAFFDSSYRARVDLRYLARRWRQAGIAALHVAAWHFLDSQKDAYLRDLIESCHRHGILVYAWLELPHVSEQFWNDHPEWREKTALLQDAHLDWRKLMNLANPQCQRAAARHIRGLLEKFDWDGVNLAELYFESLEGISNPSRFTPMNPEVRSQFRAARGFDPLELFDPGSPRRHSKNPEGTRAFLDFRADLARRMQTEWLAELEAIRASKPDLDLVLTHVDDCYDPGIRDSIGADAARVLPLLDRHNFTFLIEDPATVWHLGPQRYSEIARRYQALTRRTEKLGVDINVVERYQDVYPTKQQTGAELFQLVHQASQSFPRVALYFENSILPPDLPLLPAAATAVSRAERIGPKLAVDSPYPVGLLWKGPALVNGRLWPVTDGSQLWLPAGPQIVEAASAEPPARLLDFNGDLRMAGSLPNGLELAYHSSSRALALLDRQPVRLQIDGVEQTLPPACTGPPCILRLPRGQHLVTILTE
jgi:hypothetical protein